MTNLRQISEPSNPPEAHCEETAAWARQYNDAAFELEAEDDSLFSVPVAEAMSWYMHEVTAAEPSQAFVQALFDLANELCDCDDPTRAWIGTKVAEIAYRAKFLDATSGEDFDDRDAA